MAKIKGVHKIKKLTADGPVWYHYTQKEKGEQFWKGPRDDDDQTPGYRDAYDAARSGKCVAPPPSAPGVETVSDMAGKWQRSREWAGLEPRTAKDYRRGLKNILDQYGAAPAEEFFNDPDAGGLVISWIEDRGWRGKEADYRFDAIKCLASWLSGRFPTTYPRSQFKGLKKFYKSPDRSEVVWTETETNNCIEKLRSNLSAGVVFGRDIGGRVGDLTKLGPQHVHKRADGRLAIIFRPSKGKRHGRIANVIATDRVRAIIEAHPPGQETFLAKADGTPWTDPHELSKEVMEAARNAKLVRPGLRFNDLRGTRATELSWNPTTSIPKLALQMGWGQENAARMLGVYASLNPDALEVAPSDSSPT